MRYWASITPALGVLKATLAKSSKDRRNELDLLRPDGQLL